MSFKSKLISVLIISFIGAVLLRTFVLEGFIVVGDSMEPTIHSGDYVFINKLAFIWSEPQRGDIIIASPRDMARQKVIKRIIGLPGDRFSIEEGAVVIRVERLEEGTRLEEGYLTGTSTPLVGTTRINLDPQEYFALGDNRAVSIDSRELGPIDSWQIKGRAFGAFSLTNFKYRGF